MSILHLHVDGVARLQQPPFIWCHTCMMAKSVKHAIPAPVKTAHKPGDAASCLIPQQETQSTPGTRFHMDMGFC